MSLPRDLLAGELLPLDDPQFLVAAEVAVIDEVLAAAIEGPRVAFDRAHVEALRVAGATRDDARSYFETLFPARMVARLMDDLDSYGEWA